MTEECTPFGPEHLVYKVGGKMYALTDMEDCRWVNLKCDPDRAVALRDRHAEIVPGWHMNKRHWNTVALDGDLPDGLVRELVRHSYLLVVGSLPRAVRETISPIPGGPEE
mgnify:FL=1